MIHSSEPPYRTQTKEPGGVGQDPLDRIIIECDESTNELLYLNKCGKSHKKETDILNNGEEIPGKTSVREYHDNDTGLWYQCWDSVIRWYNGKLIRLEIAMNITARKQIESQILQLCNLRERLFTPKPLLTKLQDITDTAVPLFGLSLSCIWLFQNIIDISRISLLHDESWTACQNPKKQKLKLIISSSKKNEIPLLISSLSTFSGYKSGIPDIMEPVEIENPEDFFHSLRLHIKEQARTYNLHHSEIFPLIDASGKTIGYTCSFRENEFISEEQQLLRNLAHITSQVIISDLAMQAHVRTMEKYQILVDNLPQGVFLKDNDLRYISFNKRFAIDAGVEWSSLFGKKDSNIFPASLAKMSSELDNSVLISRDTRESVFEYIQDDKTRWIESIRTPLIDNDGNVSGILGIMHDITRRKLAEEELQCLYNELEVRVEARTEELLRTQESFHQANRKLNLLNSITRHDILNQITALYAYLEFAREQVTDPSTLEYLEKAVESARMIHEQIAFTKLYQDIGVNAPLWQPVRQVISRVIRSIQTDSVTITMSLQNIEVYADPLLEKVFYTLIDNSIRHGNHVSHIHFSFKKTSNTLTIWYEDNGTGIEPDNKTRIFERGFGKNTGLGLFLAEEILTITGSSISETGEYRKGVRFELTFPNDCFRICSE
ncbi:PAS domain-containing sensor histidine kinase [Methanospirillum stamsii]|nr:PAS domain-containing sensor histidine kinase [Methanospirillum stamsii]